MEPLSISFKLINLSIQHRRVPAGQSVVNTTLLD